MAREIVYTKDAFFPPKTIPLSQAIKCNGLIFLMGIGGRDATGKVVGPDIRTQARRCLTNAQTLLGACGASLSNAVRITCYLTRIEDADGFNEVYSEFIKDQPPVRSFFFIPTFRDPTLLCEIEVTAEDPNFKR